MLISPCVKYLYNDNDISRRLLDDIGVFVQKQVSQPLLKTLFTKDDRIARIEGYHRQISALVNAFQVRSYLRVFYVVYLMR